MLNLGAKGNGAGDYLDFIKYNAKAKTWEISIYDKEVSTRLEYELVSKPVFLMDLKNVVTGWFHFVAGGAPSILVDYSLEEEIAQPTLDHKKGLALILYNEKGFKTEEGEQVGAGQRFQFTVNSQISLNAVNNLYVQLHEEEEFATMVPAVRVKGYDSVKNKHGTNFAPIFEFVSWMERPEGLLDIPAIAFSKKGVTVAPAAEPKKGLAVAEKKPAPAKAKAPAEELYDDDVPF